MRIETIICYDAVQAKLESKHKVTCGEAREVLMGRRRIRFAENGHTEGEDVYAAFGQTNAGRYLSVFFIYKPITSTAVIISAHAMSNKERATYGRK
jgi:hypothetical protein